MNLITPAELAALQQQLADRLCSRDIEDPPSQTDVHGRRWYDTRPMIDPREVPDVVIDMNVEVLTYLHERGLISPHPVNSYLVRLMKAGL